MVICTVSHDSQIDENSFDSSDNFIVIVLPTRDIVNYPAEQVQRLKAILPKGVNLYYTLKNGELSTKLKLMFYKGMRRSFYNAVDLTVDKDLDEFREEMHAFFKPQSQDETTLIKDENIPEFVTFNNFESHVCYYLHANVSFNLT